MSITLDALLDARRAGDPELAGARAGVDAARERETVAPVKARKAFPRRALVAVGAALVLGAAGVAYILSAKGAETTDNAYVQADKTVVAPKVRGLVAQVLVA